MASARKIFSLDKDLEFCTQTDNEAENDILDNSTGEMSSGEEGELQNTSDLEADLSPDATRT